MDEAAHFAKFKRRMKVTPDIGILTQSPTNGNGSARTVQETMHLPDRLPLRMRLRERIKKAATVVTAKSDQGRYSISQQLGLAILGFVLAFGGIWYWRSSDTIQAQHDEIIRLQTRLDLEKEKNIDQDSKIDQARATAQIADKNAARLEGKFDQFALQYTIGNPKKNVTPFSQ